MDIAQLTKDYLAFFEEHIGSSEELEYLVRLVLATYEHQPHWGKDERTGETSFLKVAGKTFRCVCSGNVFSKMKSGRYECNACNRLYGGH